MFAGFVPDRKTFDFESEIHLILTVLCLCLPFRLKPLDIEFMKRLHDKVNVIPLIAKADTLTPEECQLFKKQVFVSLYVCVISVVKQFVADVVSMIFFCLCVVYRKTNGRLFGKWHYILL